MTGPRRIQRRRTPGWRTPPNTVYVGRPTRWGNPFTVADGDRATTVAAYRTWLTGQPELIAAARTLLAGRNLSCWCPTGQPCHADVLLAVANGQDPTP